MMNVVVQKRSQEVVRCRDGVKVASEMEINIRRRNKERAAPARSASLHSEQRAERRFAQGQAGAMAQSGKALSESDRCSRIIPANVLTG